MLGICNALIRDLLAPTRSNSDRKLYEGRYAARSPSEPVAGSRLSPTTPKNEWKSTPSIAGSNHLSSRHNSSFSVL